MSARRRWPYVAWVACLHEWPFGGSVITCSRNNERLILSSYLHPRLLSSSVTTYRPFVLLPFQPAFRSPDALWPFDLSSRARTARFSFSFFFLFFPSFLLLLLLLRQFILCVFVYYFLCPLFQQHFVVVPVDGETIDRERTRCIRVAPRGLSRPLPPRETRKIRISVGQVRRGKLRPGGRTARNLSPRPSNLLTASNK